MYRNFATQNNERFYTYLPRHRIPTGPTRDGLRFPERMVSSVSFPMMNLILSHPRNWFPLMTNFSYQQWIRSFIPVLNFLLPPYSVSVSTVGYGFTSLYPGKLLCSCRYIVSCDLPYS